MAREETEGVNEAAAGFEVGTTCLLVARLGVLQGSGGLVQITSAGFDIKRQ